MKRLRLAVLIAAALIVLFITIFLMIPSEIDPVAWTPQPAPSFTGPFAENRVLDLIEPSFKGQFVGPEDIAQDRYGHLYTGVADGRIMRFDADLKSLAQFANTGGRPLGMQFDANGNLIVCDAHKGLLSVDPAGAVSVLATEEGGQPFGFTDDLDIAKDGTIYFTDASWKFHAPNYLADLMEMRGNGRFLKFNPVTKKVTKLIGDLCFANGVALSPDESFVLVNETWKNRILRYWLTGDKHGTWDVLIDNLPGFPDNISCNGRDTFWVALANPRNPQADALGPHPFLRKQIWKLPQSLLPKTVRYSFVLGLDRNGAVVHNLQGPSGILAPVTSVNEYDGQLWLGSVEDDALARVAVPK